ncbi:di-trans,poly-cis-decaprenylcistransferase [Candidatus Microgenomates bacterium]|nr:di-trans,poly-cis-decaprenylcistransferase [Candidatus Microgenomates bacterium]
MDIPIHVAIIMDGNRRWAMKRNLRFLAGHEKVAFEVIESLLKKCIELKISYLTLWAWSTENWKRNKREVKGIMKILKKALKSNFERLHQMGVKLLILGDLSKFDKNIKEGAFQCVEVSKNNQTITLSIAINYGGRDEIMRAINKLRANSKFEIRNSKLTEKEFSQFLDTAAMPDPDLIIRTGGERRLSGFMLWQSEYSELYFTDVLMPDFGPEELEKAIKEYGQRRRRFGR